MAGVPLRVLRVLTTVALIALTAGAPLLAQSQSPGQEEFRPISPEEAALERLPATPFVFWAYALVWLVLILYVFSLWRRLGRVERELETIHTRLGARRP